MQHRHRGDVSCPDKKSLLLHHQSISQEFSTVNATIQHHHRIETEDRVSLVDLSRDGHRIAIVAQKTVTVCDADSGEAVSQWHCRADVVDASLSADGDQIAVAFGHPLIDVYDVASAKVTSQPDRAGGPDFLWNDAQQHLAFYPDGNKLVSSGMKRRVYVSDVRSGKWDYITFVKFTGRYDLSVSADGEHVVLFGQQNRPEISGHVTMYRVNRGLQPMWTKWHDGDGRVRHTAFSPSGKRLATSGAGDGLRIWDVASGEPIQHLGDDVQTAGVALLDDDHVVAASPNGIDVTHVDSKVKLASQKTASVPRGLAAAADGSLFATFGEEAAVDLWSIASNSTQKNSGQRDEE